MGRHMPTKTCVNYSSVTLFTNMKLGTLLLILAGI